MTGPNRKAPDDGVPRFGGPVLDASARERLGRELQTLYGPMLDEDLDPQMIELLLQLDQGEVRRQMFGPGIW